MNKTLVVALCLTTISMVACKKDEKACYQCKTDSTTSAVVAPTVEQNLCDKTQSEIDDMTKAGTGTTTTTVSGIPVTTVSKMECSKK